MSYRPTPRKLSPPKPDLSNLTQDELEQLKKVLLKQEQFENELEESIGGLKKTMSYLLKNQNSINEIQSRNSINSGNCSGRINQTSKPEQIVKNETQSSSSSSFLSRFTSLKSLVDENLHSPSETFISSSGIGSGFLSKFSSSISNSSSTASLSKNICFICKKQVVNNNTNETASTTSKFKKWKFSMTGLTSGENKATNKSNNNNNNETIMQCVDCLNFVCDRCGNLTSPDLVKHSTKCESSTRSNDVCINNYLINLLFKLLLKVILLLR